ncbi:translation elongation factor Ts [Candidatus Uhrbacteria bacterium RIFCSPHIGHO2_01_FULL_63_20]|uniref:Elongation factor Ts n=1 Tax=Candidatus Uhrbacteria bacterium RIFCSPHIGHO2_01_FULL_63_20 TaxID=1802385 RepID=A0A1F7TMH6_9BACT|nr:MAG: translation elongation factor Ts [Candidatus Uhrbacteria bacterium RIFCSPHIGHO2_01_FULL_63_20]
MIDAKTVATLREMTNAGMMDAKRALEEAGGNLEAAAEMLRKKGIAKAVKKADRVTNEGRVHAYVHGTGKLGVLVEVLCETDFVARNEAFLELCQDLALHISASDPLYVSRDAVPVDLVEKQQAMIREESAAGAKSAEILEKMVEGRLSKWYQEIVLVEQAFVKDEDKTIEDLVKEKIALLGENIQVRRFARFQIG